MPFSIEHLCELPANLAKTELVVRPCVALLHSFDPHSGANADPEVSLIPQLDAREVAAVFTAPFHQFLCRTEPTNYGTQSTNLDTGTTSHRIRANASPSEDPGEWYRGSWSLWHNSNWRSRFCNHFFFLYPFSFFFLLFLSVVMMGPGCLPLFFSFFFFSYSGVHPFPEPRNIPTSSFSGRDDSAPSRVTNTWTKKWNRSGCQIR